MEPFIRFCGLLAPRKTSFAGDGTAYVCDCWSRRAYPGNGLLVERGRINVRDADLPVSTPKSRSGAGPTWAASLIRPVPYLMAVG